MLPSIGFYNFGAYYLIGFMYICDCMNAKIWCQQKVGPSVFTLTAHHGGEAGAGIQTE